MRKLIMFISIASFVFLAACGSLFENSKESNNKNKEETSTETKERESDETTSSEDNENDLPDYNESEVKTIELYAKSPAIDSVVTMKYYDDYLLEQYETTKFFYKNNDIKNKEDAEQTIKDEGYLEQYKDEPGVEHDFQYEEDYLIETLNFDFKTANLAKVSSIPEGTEATTPNYVSKEMSVEYFKTLGYYEAGHSTEKFELDTNNQYTKVTLERHNNEIIKQTSEFEDSYSNIGVSNKKEAEPMFQDTYKQHDEINEMSGAHYEVELKETSYIIKSTVDHTKIDVEQFLEIINQRKPTRQEIEEFSNYTSSASSMLNNGYQYVPKE